jgi:hypothetical protein
VTTGASRCDDDFIFGNSNIPLRGGGGEGEDLTTNDSWDPSPPSYHPPSSRTDPSLFRRWLRPLPQRRQRNIPTFFATDVVSLTERLYPPPPAVAHSEAFGGWSKVGGVICVGNNINEAYGKPYLSDTRKLVLHSQILCQNSLIFSISQIRNIYTSAKVQNLWDRFCVKKISAKNQSKKITLFFWCGKTANFPATSWRLQYIKNASSWDALNGSGLVLWNTENFA